LFRFLPAISPAFSLSQGLETFRLSHPGFMAFFPARYWSVWWLQMNALGFPLFFFFFTSHLSSLVFSFPKTLFPAPPAEDAVRSPCLFANCSTPPPPSFCPDSFSAPPCSTVIVFEHFQSRFSLPAFDISSQPPHGVTRPRLHVSGFSHPFRDDPFSITSLLGFPCSFASHSFFRSELGAERFLPTSFCIRPSYHFPFISATSLPPPMLRWNCRLNPF